MSAAAKTTSAIALYVAIAFLNGGYHYNHTVYDPYTYEHLRRGPNAVMAGAFWPVYWAGRLAVEVTK